MAKHLVEQGMWVAFTQTANQADRKILRYGQVLEFVEVRGVTCVRIHTDGNVITRAESRLHIVPVDKRWAEAAAKEKAPRHLRKRRTAAAVAESA